MRQENKARLTVAVILLAAAVILFFTIKYIISKHPVWAGDSGQAIRTVIIDPGHGASINTKQMPRFRTRHFSAFRNVFLDCAQPNSEEKCLCLYSRDF